MSKFRHGICVSIALATPITGGGVAMAQTAFADIDAIEAQVVGVLGASIGEPGGPARPIDRRLRLIACPQPVSVEEPALGAVTVRCVSQGWRIRVPLTADSNSARTASAGGAGMANRGAPLVRRGDQVTVVAMSATFTVSTVGTAEQDGAIGDRIRVRTQGRPAPIVGQVLEDGRIALSVFN